MQGHGEEARFRLDALSIAGGCAVLGLVAWFSVQNREYELDDALIYFRYLRNALDGHGLVYNPGEWHNGLTSPLYTHLAWLVSWLAGGIRGPLWVLASLLTVGALAALFALFARGEKRPVFAVLGCGYLASSLYTYSVYGLETPLFVGLSALCLLLWERERIFGLGVAGALLVLCRGEGALLLLAMAAVHLWRGRPLPRPRDFALPALLLLANAAHNQATYGAPLPETLMAKIHQGRSGLWGSFPFVRHAGSQLAYFAGSGVLFTAWLLLAAAGVRRLGRRDASLAILLFLFLLTVFYTALQLPQYHWYYAPYHFFGAMYAGLGAAWLYDQARHPAGRVATVAVAVGVLVTLAWSTATQPLGQSTRERDYRRIAAWLERNTRPDARVAMIEVGIVGYHSRRPVVDILGVVSPGNAQALGDRRFGDWRDLHRPDLILLHEPLVPHERAAMEGLPPGAWRRHPRFDVPGYVLLTR
ncbi:MAG: hypothetical protein ACQGVC_22325 [Myxococcota bacterium]